MANEPIQGGPYPVQSDAANVPSDIRNVVDWAAPKLNMTFATEGERDALIPAPSDGMMCTIGSGSAAEAQVYIDGAWRPIMTKAVAGRRQGSSGDEIVSNEWVSMNPGPVAWLYGGVVASGNGLQVPVDGLYSLDAMLRWLNVSDSDGMQARLAVNGTSVAIYRQPRSLRYCGVSTVAPLSAGDVVELYAYNYGPPVDTSYSSGDPHLTVALVARM